MARRNNYGKEDWRGNLPPSPNDPNYKICGAIRKGKTCTLTAGWYTDHYGYGSCKFHGGTTPNGKIAAAKEEAMEAARIVMGPALDIEPMDALLLCVRIAAGEVAYTTWKIEELDSHEALVIPETTTQRDATGDHAESFLEIQKTNAPLLNIWIVARREATDRLAKYSKMALDAGIAQRQLDLAEQAGDALSEGLRDVLVGLELTAEQEEKAPALIRDMLQKLEQRQQGQPLELTQ